MSHPEPSGGFWKTAGAVASGVMLGCFGLAAVTFIVGGVVCNRIADSARQSQTRTAPDIDALAAAGQREADALPARTLDQPPPALPTPYPIIRATPYPENPGTTYQQNTPDKAEIQRRINLVGNTLTQSGCDVEWRNGTLYITLPTAQAMVITQRQSREIAKSAWEAIGVGSVIVQTPARQRLAESDVWGTR